MKTNLRNRDFEIMAAGGDFMICFHDESAEGGTVDASQLPRIKNVFDMLDAPREVISRFRKSYNSPEAREKRFAAIVGIQKHADTELSNLMNDAVAYHRRMREADRDIDMAGVDAMAIAERLAALVAAGDHRPFQRMAAIVKSGGAREGEKGGKHSVDGMVFDAFCRFVFESQKLPTKKELRERCGLTAGKMEGKLFREACNRLGLAGLPAAA